jgi:hypothetical protein
MLGVQLKLNGDKLVTCGSIPVGLMTEGGVEDCLGVLRILNNEYAEQIRLIRSGIEEHKKNSDYLNSVSLLQDELIVTVRYPSNEFRETCENYCYPMKIDNLIFSYIKCRKAFVIKQSVFYIKSELKKLKVII